MKGHIHRKGKKVLLIIFTILLPYLTFGQVDYGVYANIIYRFTKYINWPDNKKTGDFVIAVLGETPLYDELKALTKNKKVGNQPIVVRYISPNSKSFNAHILFIADDESGKVRSISEATAGKPVLIVSEHHGLISRGSCINFITLGDNLKLEFGKSHIENRDMNIASELLNLGTTIN